MIEMLSDKELEQRKEALAKLSKVIDQCLNEDPGIYEPQKNGLLQIKKIINDEEKKPTQLKIEEIKKVLADGKYKLDKSWLQTPVTWGERLFRAIGDLIFSPIYILNAIRSAILHAYQVIMRDVFDKGSVAKYIVFERNPAFYEHPMSTLFENALEAVTHPEKAETSNLNEDTAPATEEKATNAVSNPLMFSNQGNAPSAEKQAAKSAKTDKATQKPGSKN